MMAMLFAACYNTQEQGSSVVSIASLRDSQTNSRSVLITDNIIIEGVITANNEYGEFYNYLIIEDQSAALKIMCEMDDNYCQYPFGQAVSVNCSGLYLINHYGSIILGAEPTGEYTLDYIAQDRVGQYIKLAEQSATPLEPTPIEIEQLTPLDIYRYVRLEQITLSNNEGVSSFCARDSESGRCVDTTHTITDESGNTIELFVDQWCSYADAELPTELCDIAAIVNYYDGSYSLTITNCDYQITSEI